MSIYEWSYVNIYYHFMANNNPIVSPFYNNKTSRLFKSLYFPDAFREINFPRKLIHGFPRNKHSKSFILKNPHRYHHDIFNLIPRETPEATRVTRKIRFFPSTNQKNYLSKCFGTSRFLYNRTLKLIKDAYENAIDKLRKRSRRGCQIFC